MTTGGILFGDVHVGTLRLDIWRDGRAVVSRPPRHGEAPGSRIPLDPSVRQFMPGLAAFGLGSLIASVIACAGAVGLFQAGKAVIAVGVLVVALAIAVLGGIWSLGWLIPRAPGHFVTLDGATVDLFKQTAEDELLTLGESPKAEDVDAASVRLWELACQLSLTNRGDRHNDR
jgi:hypothetical protein